MSALRRLVLVCVAWLLAPGGAEASRFQQFAVGACGPTAICNIDFPVVPAGKAVEVTNASCHMMRIDPAVPVRHQLQVVDSSGVTISIAVAMQPLFIGRDQSVLVGSTYTSNHQILATAIAGQRFRVVTVVAQATGSVFFQYSCHISGTQTP